MEERLFIDEMHALANGLLSSEEEERLRQRCAADPELQALLEDYLEVHALTECADEPAPPSRLTFEEVEGAFVPQRTRRMVLHRVMRVAAAVLVLVGGGLLLSYAFSPIDPIDRPEGRPAGPLFLAEIPLRAKVAEPLATPKIPTSLAEYRPVVDGKIRWISDLDQAKAMARASSRPVLLFLEYPSCPWCIEMHDDTFTHEEVLAEIPAYVPALVDIRKADPETRKLAKGGWPWFGVIDADGNVVLSFPGLKGPGQFSQKLKDACTISGPPALSWARANELARIWFEAVAAEEDERFTEAYASYAALSEVDRAPLIGKASREAIRRIGQHARGVILAARDLSAAKRGREPATTLLDDELLKFDGTPFAADLAVVGAYLKRSGRFPRIHGLK